jgi:uncharacterized BrkB/YihY/UPF0761 family membrane protein
MICDYESRLVRKAGRCAGCAGYYFQHFGNLNKTYGTLAAAIALMVWLYWTAFAVLLGGEINADLLHAEGKRIPVKEAETSTGTVLDPSRKVA